MTDALDELQNLKRDIQSLNSLLGEISEEENSTDYEDISNSLNKESCLNHISSPTKSKDKSAVDVIENLINLNERYQDLTLETIDLLENYQQIYDTQLNLKNDESEINNTTKKLEDKGRSSLFAYPYFRNKSGFSPRPNQDALAKSSVLSLDAYIKGPKNWILPNKKQLIRGVRAIYGKSLLKPLKNHKAFILEKLKKPMSDNEKKHRIQELEKLKEEISDLKYKYDPNRKVKAEEVDLMPPRDAGLNWDEIAHVYMEDRHSPEECMGMWINLLHPSVNNGPWTPEEDEKIVMLARKTGGKEWTRIAQGLGTQRTALHCLQRYHRVLKPVYNHGPWRDKEIELLRQVVAANANTSSIPWNKVSSFMEGRSASVVANKWKNLLDENYSHRKWMEEEDLVLLTIVEKLKGRRDLPSIWKACSRFLPGRSNLQCFERYANTLFLGRKSGWWSKEEDLKLIELVKKYGGNWKKLVQHLEGRTDSQAHYRYHRILKSHPFIKTESMDQIKLLFKDAEFVCSTNRTRSMINPTRIKFSELMSQADLDGEAPGSSVDKLLAGWLQTITQAENERLACLRKETEASAFRNRDQCDDSASRGLNQQLEEAVYKHFYTIEKHSKPIEELTHEEQQAFSSTRKTIANILCIDRKEEMNAGSDSSNSGDSPPEETVPSCLLKICREEGSSRPVFPVIPPNHCTIRAMNALGELKQRCLGLGKSSQPSQILSKGPEHFPSSMARCQDEDCPNKCLPSPSFQLQPSPSSTFSACDACDHLARTQREQVLLKLRLASLFLWPALLAEVPFAPRQNRRYVRRNPKRQQSKRKVSPSQDTSPPPRKLRNLSL